MRIYFGGAVAPHFLLCRRQIRPAVRSRLGIVIVRCVALAEVQVVVNGDLRFLLGSGSAERRPGNKDFALPAVYAVVAVLGVDGFVEFAAVLDGARDFCRDVGRGIRIHGIRISSVTKRVAAYRKAELERGVGGQHGVAERADKDFSAGVVFGCAFRVVPDFFRVAVKTDIHAVFAEVHIGGEPDARSLVGYGLALTLGDERLPISVVELAVDSHVRVGDDVVFVEEVILLVAAYYAFLGYANPAAGLEMARAFKEGVVKAFVTLENARLNERCGVLNRVRLAADKVIGKRELYGVALCSISGVYFSVDIGCGGILALCGRFAPGVAAGDVVADKSATLAVGRDANGYCAIAEREVVD